MTVDFDEARRKLDEEGFVVLEQFFSGDELASAAGGLVSMYPTPDEFHDDVDPKRNEPFKMIQFGGIRRFPFAARALSLLALHDRLLDLSEALLGTSDIRLYNGEAWAKYTGAVDYDQTHHRDFENHTILVPSDDIAFRQLEFFVYLADVTEDLGPTHVVPRQAAAGLPATLGRASREEHPQLYDAEVSAAAPAGTVLAYTTDTFHRGTNMTKPRGARFTIHLNLRPAGAEWAQRQCWVDQLINPGWYELVESASPRQLAVLGWPPPGHPYWTEHTLAGMAQRYPKRDFTPWRT